MAAGLRLVAHQHAHSVFFASVAIFQRVLNSHNGVFFSGIVRVGPFTWFIIGLTEAVQSWLRALIEGLPLTNFLSALGRRKLGRRRRQRHRSFCLRYTSSR